VLNFRVLPNDIDISKITNDRFIAIMDLGRMDIGFRVGLIRSMLKNKWVPLATFDTIRFRHHLSIFQKYQLRSRIIYWDEKSFYFEQRFERFNRTIATGYVCATLLGPNGPISPDDIITATGQQVNLPEKTRIVSKLQEIEHLIHESQRENIEN
jgi:acyl-CoA thioesterase FadM